MIKVAITGNIASGKSAVEKLLSAKGFTVYDTDKIAHELLENSNEVRESFKDFDIYTDNKIDRKKLGKIVFSDKTKLEILEQIIHPQVRNKLLEIFEKDDFIVFVSVPQLFEAKLENLFDKIVFVTAPENIRLERLMNRNNLSKEDALARISAQEKDENKIPKCNYVIQNNADLTNLERQVNGLLASIC